MRRRILFAITVAALVVGPSAMAQEGRTSGTGRTPGTPRVESTQGRTPGTPGTEGTPGTPGTPGTDRIPRPGSPSSLPTTGVSTTELALDAVTLLGAGSLLAIYRRRRMMA